MSAVDASRRRFLRLGGLLDRRWEPEPSSAAGEGTPFVGPAPAPPWERARPAVATKFRFAQIRKPYCLAYAGSTCTTCLEHCPLPDVIQLRAGKPVIDGDACDGCGACADACPAPGSAVAFIPYFAGDAP